MWEKLKVIELASVLAGPLVGTYFAELGAEVIKIENKTTGGDVTRQWKLASEDPTSLVSAYYASANYGKRSLFLDLKSREGYEETIALIKSADIVIQNFKAGDAKKLKLDGEYLFSLKPELIIASISGFGPNSERPAFDVVLQAETGFMSMNGSPTSGPIKMPVALIDVLAAHHLKEAILVALVEKSVSGKGKLVHVSLYDAAIASLANQASNFLMEGHIPQAIGTAHPNIAPYGDLYQTKDGKQLVLAIGNDKQFESLSTNLVGLKEHLAEFKTNNLRLQQRAQLNKLISKAIGQFNATDLATIFLAKGIPFGIVKNLAEVFNEESAIKMVQEVKNGSSSTKRVRTILT